MKRTTGVNYFRIATVAPKGSRLALRWILPEGSSSRLGVCGTILARPHPLKVTEDNIKLRESGQVQEKWFDTLSFRTLLDAQGYETRGR
jgi:hypothetical protein